MAAILMGKDVAASRRRRRRRARPMSEINVTPFVDVMLVLLIIFMVAAPLTTVGVPVELPKTAAPSLPSEQEEPLAVTLTAEGLIQIQTTEVTEDQIVPRLQAILSERSSDKVFLRADNVLDARNISNPEPFNWPLAPGLDGFEYRVYYSETGNAGGAVLSEDQDGDGQEDWVPLNDPRVFQEGRSVRVGLALNF